MLICNFAFSLKIGARKPDTVANPICNTCSFNSSSKEHMDRCEIDELNCMACTIQEFGLDYCNCYLETKVYKSILKKWFEIERGINS